MPQREPFSRMDPRSERGVSVLEGVTLPDRYEPMRRIARGGMATVWCAHDRTLDRRVAIKLLADPYAHDELAGRRFMREARAAARLSGHANVVTIYDVGRATADPDPPGQPFLVMEYLPGGTVADALRTGELDQDLILRWLRQAAAALDYGHRRGVIHRDVKLSNFLLDRERELHVADFGIAQLGAEDTLSSSGEVLGTAAYLAPERALGLPASEASDRYALAVAAFELLVGERPFRAEHFAAQARQHLEQAPPLASRRNPALPAALDTVLARGMAKAPEQRFETASALVDAIEQALVPATAPAAVTRLAAPVAATRVLPPELSVYGRRGHGRTLAVAALTLVALAVAIAAGATVLRTHAPARPHRVLAARHVAPKVPVHTASDHPARTASTPAQSSPPPQVQSPPPPAALPTPASLEQQGHQLMVGGQYHRAIPVLKKAVASAPRSSLTYAYALFDLGRSLRLAGDPRAAVPILWQRLQIPNQTDVVRNELALALEALGQSQSASGLSASTQQPGARGRGNGDGQGD